MNKAEVVAYNYYNKPDALASFHAWATYRKCVVGTINPAAQKKKVLLTSKFVQDRLEHFSLFEL